MKNGIYEPGSVFVMDRMNYAEDDKKIMDEGKRKVLLVMVKDDGRFKETGGWGFEGFKGGDANQGAVADGGKARFGCHAPLKDTGFVFSKVRD